MALKDILVLLDSDPRCSERLEIAAALARRHTAVLTGLYVVDIPDMDYLYGAGLPMAGIGPDELIDTMRTEARTAAEPIRTAFQAALQRDDLSGDWQLIEGYTTGIVGAFARNTDLVIAGQPNEPHRRDNHSRIALETALMVAGRPVLTIPYAGSFKKLTDHVLIAWNASREATRAVHDALPLLQEARTVTVLAVNPDGLDDTAPGSVTTGFVTHLRRHGVEATAASTATDHVPDGDALLSYASDIGATLLVAGAYGHARAREMIFGGVTRTLLTEMTLPVLFSH